MTDEVKIGCGFDGTLVNYGFVAGEPVKVNEALLDKLQGKRIAIITNQGGLPFGIMNAKRNDGHKYPLPEHFFQRYSDFVDISAYRNVWVEGLYISVYHSRASISSCYEADQRLQDLFANYYPKLHLRTYLTETYRKPHGLMLVEADIDVYYGDSDEDEGAALSAECEFVKVERFF